MTPANVFYGFVGQEVPPYDTDGMIRQHMEAAQEYGFGMKVRITHHGVALLNGCSMSVKYILEHYFNATLNDEMADLNWEYGYYTDGALESKFFNETHFEGMLNEADCAL